MNKRDIQLLFAYNHWANTQMLNAVSALTAEQFIKDLATGHRSVHGTLTHILAGEWIYLVRCKGISPRASPDPADFPSLTSLSEKWAEVERDQREFMNELTDESLATVITYTNTKGEQWTYPLWQIMQHVVNHSTYHRGQVSTMLRQLGEDAVATDFLVYIDTRPEDV